MSNCIHLHDTRQATTKVVFLRDEIDVEGFKKFLDGAKQLNRNEFDNAGKRVAPYTEEELNANMAWWFLQTNSVVDHRGAVIYFGEGRSIHTWRDLRGTLAILSRFIKKEKRHRFVATDESDGGREAFWLPVEFKSGKIS